jgi:hypothetical protein
MRLLKQFKARYHISKKAENERVNFLLFIGIVITGPSLERPSDATFGFTCPVLRIIQKESKSPKFDYPHRLPLLDEHQPVSWCYPQELMAPVG